jgi:hypothetical protein
VNRTGRACRYAVAAAVVAGASLAMTATPTSARSTATYPVKGTFTAPGPYVTTTGTVLDSTGAVADDLYYPANYAALGFKSPIITWGNGTNAVPTMYTTLLTHLSSYGFTVIASTLENTGSGREIDFGAHYLIALNGRLGSVFKGRLAVNRVAAVGHSQGAGGATRATTIDPNTIKTLITFSLPNTRFVGANPDCATAADCMFDPSLLTRPAFFISTHGLIDSVIASPATETAFFDSVSGHAALGIIERSGGTVADHSSIQNSVYGGKPGGFLGYATAWLEYQLLGNREAAAAFTGAHPELTGNADWPGSALK